MAAWKPEHGIYMDAKYNLVYPEGATHLDGIPDDVLKFIHPHWGKFPPQHPLIVHVVGIAFFFLWLLSFLGNGSVIYVFLKTATLRTPSNIFVVNLAISDLVMMTTMGLPVIINGFTQRYWMWGKLWCDIYGFLGAVCGTCSILSMVVIGYDRYNVIVKGFSGTKITKGIAFVLVIVLWVYSTLVCMPPFLGWGAYSPEGLLVTCSYDYLKQELNELTFMYYAFAFNYTVPMLTVIFFYIQIVKAVVAHEAAMKAQAKKMNVDSLKSNQKDNEASAEVKIAKVAITNVLLWVVTWTPYACVAMIGVFGNQMLITPLVAQLPSFLAKMSSCLNPVVFAVSHPKFRESIAKEIPCLGIGERPKDSNNSNTEAVKTETC